MATLKKSQVFLPLGGATRSFSAFGSMTLNALPLDLPVLRLHYKMPVSEGWKDIFGAFGQEARDMMKGLGD